MRPVAQHASSSVSSLGCIIISCRIAHNRARCDNVTARLGIRYGNQIHLRFPQTGISHVHHIDTTRCAFAASFCSSLPFSILSQQIGRRWSPKSHGQGAVKALNQTCRYLYWESRMSPSPHDRSSTTHLFDSTEENYTTSLMGIDVTGSQVEERTALLDSNNRVHYSGTTTPTRMCFSSCWGDFAVLPPSYVSILLLLFSAF